MNKFDVLIIGGGPIGLASGIAAQKAGLTYIIIEKGCLVNSLYKYPLQMTFFSTPERLEIGGIPFMSLNPKPNRAEALEYYRRVTQIYKLNIRLFEKVETVNSQETLFSIQTSRTIYTAAKIIIATGFYDIPNLLNIPGENLKKVSHYYNDPHYFAFKKILIVGASNSAVDAALDTWRKAALVTMVILKPEVGERVKYWVRPDIVNRINEGSIKAYFNSSVKAIRENEVDIQTPDGLITVANDFVLALTGYKPDFKFLEKLGIHLSNDEKKYPEYDVETMQTNRQGIYLAGVVCGGMDTHKWFIENSREHAEKIITHIVLEKKKPY
jgi:thioredoxin reductase (NADPH)